MALSATAPCTGCSVGQREDNEMALYYIESLAGVPYGIYEGATRALYQTARLIKRATET